MAGRSSKAWVYVLLVAIAICGIVALASRYVGFHRRSEHAAAVPQNELAGSISNQLLARPPAHVDATSSLQNANPLQLEQIRQEFRDNLTCHNISAQIQTLRRSIEGCTPIPGHPFDGATSAACAQSIQQSTSKIENLEQQGAHCDPNPAQMETAYASSLVRAAEAGDPDARVCFVRGKFKFNGMSEDSKEAVDKFVKQATAYAQAAFDAGDWRIVALLGLRSTYLNHAGGWITYLPIGDNLEVLRTNRLLRLGAVGSYAETLDNAAQIPAASLTAAQIQDANTWAQKAFDLYFKNSPPVTSAPDICSDNFSPGS